MAVSFDVLINEAFTAGASDVHVQPVQGECTVFFRIQGQLSARLQLTPAQAERLTAQIRVACGLDVSQRQLPQDGRFHLSDGLSGRVSIMPTLYGSAVVLRLFQLLKAESLEDLGFSGEQAGLLKTLVARPYGLILVAGPTGSGKTTTLYHLLAQARQPNRVLLSLEDPIEAEIPGVRQTACRPELGLSFASGLRSLLRQDPDVILLGEIRDGETAEIAVRAALTGHLVLSSVHARDASEALLRLLDLQVPAFQLASTLTATVAQEWRSDAASVRRLSATVLCYPPNLYELLKTQPSLGVLRSALQAHGVGNGAVAA